MSTENKPYKGDVGTVVEAETNKDLTGNSVLRLEVTKPDGTAGNWTAGIKSGDNSVAQYTIIAGDFDQGGVYTAQVYVEWASGNKFYGATFKFTVYEKGQ